MISSKNQHVKNPLEMLREQITSEIPKTIGEELVRPMANEFLNQILGKPRQKFSGEIMVGESIEIKSVLSGKQTEIDKLKKQIVVERRLFEEEKVLVEKKNRQLKLQIEAIQVETTKLAKATPQLSRQVEIAALQTPSASGVYELFFFEHLYNFIKSFREHIENAHVWLTTVNARAHKKNVWGQNYKKHGAKYLLSGEHYSGRSAA